MNWVNNLGNLWPIVPYFVVPVAVARLLCRGRWIEIFQAYGILFAPIFMFGALSQYKAEGFGWAIILGLFYTTFAIPILVLILKLRTYLKSKWGGVS